MLRARNFANLRAMRTNFTSFQQRAKIVRNVIANLFFASSKCVSLKKKRKKRKMKLKKNLIEEGVCVRIISKGGRNPRETDVTLTPARSSSVAALFLSPRLRHFSLPLGKLSSRADSPPGFGKDPREEGGLEFPYTHRRPPLNILTSGNRFPPSPGRPRPAARTPFLGRWARIVS